MTDVLETAVPRPQNLHITDTQLGTAYESLSLFSGATESQRMLMTLWAAHTHTYRSFTATPRCSFCANGSGTGKTVNMQVTTALSNEPVVVGYASQASVYSYLEEHPKATIGLDEIDKVFGSDGRKTSRAVLAAVVNDGYTSKGKVMVMRAGKAVFMPVWAPVATAGIGRLPADTLTRCLIIHLQKATPEEQYIPELHEDNLNMIGGMLNEWLTTEDSQAYLRAAPVLAKGVDGDPRFRLIMAPLGAIAALAGCYDMFLAAVRELKTGIAENPPTAIHTLMINDLREVLLGRDMPTARLTAEPDTTKVLSGGEVIALLREHPEARWSKLTSNRIGDLTIAGLMRENGIESKVRNGERGYALGDIFAGADITAQAA